ncbi:MAG: biotin/lipoyl-containing protein, partial [Halioglobus sp.]
HQLGLIFHEQEFRVEVEQLSSTPRYAISFGDRTVQAQGTLDGSQLRANIDGYQLQASIAEHDGTFSLYTQHSALSFQLAKPDLGDDSDTGAAGGLNAPMNGTMVTLLVDVGGQVSKDDPLLVMEAMKMEHTIRAPADGMVLEFYYQPGDLVDGGAELLSFEVTE